MWPRLRLLYSCCGCAPWPLLTVLGSLLILRPLIGFVLGLVAWLQCSTSYPGQFFSLIIKKQGDYCPLRGYPSLTFILAIPQVLLFNFSNLWYVQSNPIRDVLCASSSHTPDSTAPDCAQAHTFGSPERHFRRPYSRSSLCSGHPTSEISMYAPYRMLQLNDIIYFRYADCSTN